MVIVVLGLLTTLGTLAYKWWDNNVVEPREQLVECTASLSETAEKLKSTDQTLAAERVRAQSLIGAAEQCSAATQALQKKCARDVAAADKRAAAMLTARPPPSPGYGPEHLEQRLRGLYEQPR